MKCANCCMQKVGRMEEGNLELELGGIKKKLLLIIAALSIIVGTVAVIGLKINPQDKDLIINSSTEADKKVGETANEPVKGTAKGPIDDKNKLENYIYIHVVGAVQKPSLYKMKEGERVYDAIKLAKPSKEADLEQVNLAEKLVDGSQIVIPVKGGNQGVANTSTTGSANKGYPRVVKGKSSSGKININYAGIEELDQLKGVGPSLAKKIIDYRKAKGRFKTIEELNNVPGIGDKKLQDIRQNITL
jgi:competence protein ComEA